MPYTNSSYLKKVILRKGINEVIEMLLAGDSPGAELSTIANHEYIEAIEDIEKTSHQLIHYFNQAFFNIGNSIYKNRDKTKTFIEVNGICTKNLEHIVEGKPVEITSNQSFILQKLNDEELATFYSPICDKKDCNSKTIPTASHIVSYNAGGIITQKFKHRIKTTGLAKKIVDKKFKIYELADFLGQVFVQHKEEENILDCNHDDEIFARFKFNNIVNEPEEYRFEDRNKIKKNPEILDMSAFRIYTETVRQCYQVENVFKEMENKGIINIMKNYRKDYIERPKQNGYQSLHIFIMYAGRAHEIQVRTYEMDNIAEKGDAKHRFYKKMLDLARNIVGEPYQKAIKELDEVLHINPHQNQQF